MVKIKALSLSGGSYLGFYMLGALKHSFESGFIDYHNLKHIYGISVGSIMGVFTAMNMDWNMLTDYAIERPWHKLFGIKTSNIMNCIDNNGMYNIGLFYVKQLTLCLMCSLKNIMLKIEISGQLL